MELTQFDLLKAYAEKYYDGHYTVMRFTTNYRVAFGTICSTDINEIYGDINRMAEGESLERACKMCIEKNISL